MANRWFNPVQYTFEKAPVTVWAQILGNGATNGPLTVSRGRGVASASQNTTGLWTITLQDLYNALLSLNVSVQSKDGSTIPLVIGAYLMTQNVTAVGGAVFTLQFVTASNVPGSPVLNEVVLLEFVLSNSTAV